MNKLLNWSNTLSLSHYLREKVASRSSKLKIFLKIPKLENFVRNRLRLILLYGHLLKIKKLYKKCGKICITLYWFSVRAHPLSRQCAKSERNRECTLSLSLALRRVACLRGGHHWTKMARAPPPQAIGGGIGGGEGANRDQLHALTLKMHFNYIIKSILIKGKIFIRTNLKFNFL